MKILLVSNYVYDRQNSMQLFAKTLEEGLRARGHDVRLIRPEPFFGRIRPSYRGIGKWLGYIDKLLLFPRQLRNEALWADIAHICDHSNAHYAKYLGNVPHLVTCNDMLAVQSALGEFTQNPTGWTGRCLQRMIVNGLKRSKRIVCISQATRDGVMRICGLSPKDASVIYMGQNYAYAPMNKETAAQIIGTIGIDTDKPFLLHVGKDNWYKNRLGALKIFRKFIETPQGSSCNFVFAGAPLSKAMADYVSGESLHDRVFALTGLDQEDLQALYSRALALLYPSIAEGFGWPIIEAQACGCPVFTTGRAPMTEAGGDAAVYFDPDRPEEAARIIGEGLKDAAGMRERGFANVKRFSTDGMVQQYIEVYREAVRGQKSG